MEGIVAGVPSLATYDVIIDAGSSAKDDPESAVPFDLELADGRTLKQPGNLYGVMEGALWGTDPPSSPPRASRRTSQQRRPRSFGDVLPDADVIGGGARPP